MSQDLVAAQARELTAWEQLTADAQTVAGGDLEKGDVLIGYPMCFTGVTFRQGDYVNGKSGEKGFYVSIETVIGPETEINRGIRRGRIPENNVGACEPGEQLVFNEAGTGVYRQIVAFLEDSGRIRIKSELPKEGAYGASRYDVTPAEWDVDETAEFRFDGDGNPVVAFGIRLLCPRGLRASDYENEFTKSGHTRYVA
jgi:hypothetical protein